MRTFQSLIGKVQLNLETEKLLEELLMFQSLIGKVQRAVHVFAAPDIQPVSIPHRKGTTKMFARTRCFYQFQSLIGKVQQFQIEEIERAAAKAVSIPHRKGTTL